MARSYGCIDSPFWLCAAQLRFDWYHDYTPAQRARWRRAGYQPVASAFGALPPEPNGNDSRPRQGSRTVLAHARGTSWATGPWRTGLPRCRRSAASNRLLSLSLARATSIVSDDKTPLFALTAADLRAARRSDHPS